MVTLDPITMLPLFQDGIRAATQLTTTAMTTQQAIPILTITQKPRVMWTNGDTILVPQISTLTNGGNTMVTLGPITTLLPDHTILDGKTAAMTTQCTQQAIPILTITQIP